MGRIVKCQLESCGKTHDYKLKETLIKVEKKVMRKEVEKTINLYYCNDECYNLLLKKEEYSRQERAETDELNDVVKNIYGIGVNFNLPQRWWELIQDLRNGTNRYQKFWKRKYKSGVPFKVMAEAYRMSRADIQWAKLNRKFKTTDQELRYGLSVMGSKLIDAHKRLKQSEIEEVKSKAMEKMNIDIMEDNREVVYKKQILKDDDLSFLLGDD